MSTGQVRTHYVQSYGGTQHLSVPKGSQILALMPPGTRGDTSAYLAVLEAHHNGEYDNYGLWFTCEGYGDPVPLTAVYLGSYMRDGIRCFVFIGRLA